MVRSPVSGVRAGSERPSGDSVLADRYTGWADKSWVNACPVLIWVGLEADAAPGAQMQAQIRARQTGEAMLRTVGLA